MTLVYSRSLPVDRARHSEKGQPMCMEQYYRLFSTYREPGVERDRLVSHADVNEGLCPQHIIVIYKNQVRFTANFYRFFSCCCQKIAYYWSSTWISLMFFWEEKSRLLALSKPFFFCQFFVLDVVVDSARLSNDNIYTQLKRIVSMAEDGAGTADKIGILTAADRTSWAKARLKLMEGLLILTT